MYAAEGTQISVESLEQGPASIECELDEAICLSNFLRKAKQAEVEGHDAIICNCFGDPGVKAARELLSVPVVGPGETSMHVAATLGQRFSVITILPNVVPHIQNLAAQCGLENRLASIRYVNISVLGLVERKRLTSALYEEMLKAMKEDDAQVLVLGCTDMLGVAKEMENRLRNQGYEVPVVAPLVTALKYAELLVSLGLRQSRLTYMSPPTKTRTDTIGILT